MALRENNPSASNHGTVNGTTTVISITSDPNTSISSVQSIQKNDSVNDCSEFHYVSNRKQAATKEISTSYLQYRLRIRNFFLTRIILVSKLMSTLAIFSIILMIIQNELVFNRLDNKYIKVAWFLKLIITFITVILLVLIWYYHHLDITLYAHRNQLKDWRVNVTWERIFFMAIELIVCAVHPVPRFYPSTDPPKIRPNSNSMSYVSLDVALSLPMFLRLYLLVRSLVIGSSLFLNIPLRLLGYFNHVSINIHFLFKAYLNKWPTRYLTTFFIVVFLIGSWSLRACDYTTTGTRMSMSDAMWLFITTATTVGYGDLYPSTYCERGIATVIGLFGILFATLLVGIVIQKLQLTREEKYVHSFVSNTQIAENRRHQAANVIKFAIKSWCLKRRNKEKSIGYFQVNENYFNRYVLLRILSKKNEV